MGRKMGINSKAIDARERKEAQKNAKKEAIERDKEDEYWRDDDKHVNRKLNRQKEKEAKQQEERDRKLANKAAYELEMGIAEKSAKSTKASTKNDTTEKKVTRHEVSKNLEAEKAVTSKDLTNQMRKINLEPIQLVPNLNRLDDGENASTIDEALDLFKSTR